MLVGGNKLTLSSHDPAKKVVKPTKKTTSCPGSKTNTLLSTGTSAAALLLLHPEEGAVCAHHPLGQPLRSGLGPTYRAAADPGRGAEMTRGKTSAEMSPSLSLSFRVPFVTPDSFHFA